MRPSLSSFATCAIVKITARSAEKADAGEKIQDTTVASNVDVCDALRDDCEETGDIISNNSVTIRTRPAQQERNISR